VWDLRIVSHTILRSDVSYQPVFSTCRWLIVIVLCPNVIPFCKWLPAPSKHLYALSYLRSAITDGMIRAVRVCLGNSYVLPSVVRCYHLCNVLV
jgi:hypothetical protein